MARPVVDRLATDVVIMRTGGIAGHDDRLEIAIDGAVERTRGRGEPDTRSLSQAEREELARLLAETGLFEEDSEHLSAGADMIRYEITYRGVTVRVDDGSVPARLESVLDWVQRELGVG